MPDEPGTATERPSPPSGAASTAAPAKPDHDDDHADTPRADDATEAAAGEDAEDAEAAEEDGGAGGGERAPRTTLPRGVKVMAGMAVAALIAGGGFQVATARLRSDDALENRALVDTTATTQVAGDVSAGLNAVLSYSPDDTSSPRQAARRILTGAAAKQYTRLMSVVREKAPKQRTELRTKVVKAAPISLSGGHAKLLVFLDQTTRRGKSGKPTKVAAQLLVTAQRQGDRWIISNIAIR